jgi:hypothetical protein
MGGHLVVSAVQIRLVTAGADRRQCAACGPISFGTERCEWLFRRDVNKPLLSCQPAGSIRIDFLQAGGRRRRPAACPETQGENLPGAAAVTNDSVCSTE